MRPGPRAGKTALLAAVLACLALNAGPTTTLAQVFTEPTARPKASPPAPRPRPRATASAPARSQPSSAAQARQTRLNDPVPYCAANPDTAEIGPDYTGQPVPDWVARAARTTGQSGSLAYNWRCVGGRVLACASKPDEQACTKPVQDTEPTPELLAFCTGKRRAVVPDDVVGNSVAIWACRQGQPAITGYRAGLDPQGYFSSQWQDVTDYSPRNMVGAIPRSLVGSWEVLTRGSGLLSFQYRIFVVFYGGQPASAIGQADYYQLNTSDGQPVRLCSTALHLRGNNPRVLDLEERYSFRTPNIACPVQGQLSAQLRDGRLLAEWRRPRDGKVTLSGWGQRN